MDDIYNKHYITLDASGNIVNGYSDAFRAPCEGDICINEQGGYQFRLSPDGEENPPLFDGESGAPLYRWDGEKITERPASEIKAAREAARARAELLASRPTREDKIEAQVTYTAMLTDTMLPEEDENV